jgi:hypothetical protein
VSSACSNRTCRAILPDVHACPCARAATEPEADAIFLGFDGLTNMATFGKSQMVKLGTKGQPFIHASPAQHLGFISTKHSVIVNGVEKSVLYAGSPFFTNFVDRRLAYSFAGF